MPSTYQSESLFYSGTSGVVLPVANKSAFPPDFQDKSRLQYYASLFSSVEINSSFYKTPMGTTVSKWADHVPDYFRFTFKLFKGITHNKGLEFTVADVDRFMQTIAQAGSKKGCLLIQLPPGLAVGKYRQLEKLLGCVTAADPERAWKVAVEFRNTSWYEEDVYDLLDAYQAEMVFHDKPSSPAPWRDTESGFKYLRFHGPNGDYKESYTDYFLHEYAEYIREAMASGRTVYTYFNNTMGEAVRNLMNLNNIVFGDSE
jgi:uncharacterized protein YecE (DUF72 family)